MRDRTVSARDVRMIGTRAPRTMPARVGLRHERQVLGQHVAGFEIGHHQNLGTSGDFGLDALDPGRLWIDGIVERQRTVEHARR